MESIKKVTAGTVTNKKILQQKYSTNLFGLSRKQWSNILDHAETIITNTLVVITFGVMPFVALFMAWFGRCLWPMTVDDFKEECPLDGLVDEVNQEYIDFDNAYEKLLNNFKEFYYEELTEGEKVQIENDHVGLLNEIGTFLRQKRYSRRNKLWAN